LLLRDWLQPVRRKSRKLNMDTRAMILRQSSRGMIHTASIPGQNPAREVLLEVQLTEEGSFPDTEASTSRQLESWCQTFQRSHQKLRMEYESFTLLPSM